MNKLREKYLEYIKALVKSFKISDEYNFRKDLANLLTSQSKNINDLETLKLWNVLFVSLIMKYTSLNPKEIEDNIKKDLQSFLTKDKK